MHETLKWLWAQQHAEIDVYDACFIRPRHQISPVQLLINALYFKCRKWEFITSVFIWSDNNCVQNKNMPKNTNFPCQDSSVIYKLRKEMFQVQSLQKQLKL